MTLQFHLPSCYATRRIATGYPRLRIVLLRIKSRVNRQPLKSSFVRFAPRKHGLDEHDFESP